MGRRKAMLFRRLRRLKHYFSPLPLSQDRDDGFACNHQTFPIQVRLHV